jgi:hypothetical protein
MSDSLLQTFWQNISVPLSSIFHILSLFCVIKNLMGVSTRALQSFFVFHAAIKDFKLEILICSNLLITEHW